MNGDTETRTLYINTTNGTGIYFKDGTFQETAAYPIVVQEEGSTVANTVKQINFVGAEVTATSSGNNVTVTVSNSAFVQANAAYDKANSVVDVTTTVVSNTSPTTVYTFDKNLYGGRI